MQLSQSENKVISPVHDVPRSCFICCCDEIFLQTQYMEGAMNATTATTTPAEQVDTLIEQVADENNLELGEAFTQAGPVGTKTPSTKEAEKPVADDLEARLANLRN